MARGRERKNKRWGRGKEEQKALVLGLDLIIVFIDYFLR